MNEIFLDVRAATPHFPGIGRYVSKLACTLPHHLGGELSLKVIYDPLYPPLWLHEIIDSGGVALPATTSLFSLGQQWSIPRLLRQNRMGAHSLYHSPYYLMPYHPGMPTVLTVYDLTPLRYPQTVSLRARILFRLCTTLALRTATTVIAISSATRADFIRTFRLPSDKVCTIPLAAEASFRPQTSNEIAAVRQKYALPQRFVLYLGINKPHKNLKRLIEAWVAIRPEGWQLLIGGAWDQRYPAIREQAASIDSVRFLGRIPENDLPALYAAADWFVFPSLYEGFGLPVLEAMACGTPVLCGRHSSLTEVAGDAALTFDPLDARDIAGALEFALGNEELKKSLAARGLTQAARFSWERTARETAAVYRETINR